MFLNAGLQKSIEISWNHYFVKGVELWLELSHTIKINLRSTFNVTSPSIGGGKPSLKSSNPSFRNSQFLPCRLLLVSEGFRDLM